MSKSAFGVEHGEVSKAFAMPKMPKMPSPGAFSAGKIKPLKPFQGLGNAMGHGAMKAGGAMQNSGMKTAVGGALKTGRMGQAKTKVGVNQMKVGGAMSRAGAGMMKRPGLTGGVTVAGTGGMGAGLAMNRKKPTPRQV